MRDLRLVAIPLVVLLAGACDNSILVAQSTRDAEAGAGGDLGDGSSAPGDAAPNEAAPGDGPAGDGGPPFEGTPNDASAEGGGSDNDGAAGTGGGDAGTGEASADAGAEAASDASAGGEGGPGGDAGADDGGATGDASTADASSGDAAGDADEAGATPDAATDAGTDGAPGEGGTTNPYGPSCDGVPNTCGPGHNESCCANHVVPGGTFNRDNNSSFPATVDTFVLDRFEVTVGRFRKFYDQYSGNQPDGGSGINSNVSSDPGWDPKWDSLMPTTASALDSYIRSTPQTSSIWIDWIVGDDDLPMNCINWYQAYAFCIWDGGRLPTELEWNYAAAGGSEQRLYPWGSATADYPYAVFDSKTNTAAVYAEVGSCSPQGDAKWGQADMAGNVMEWTEDWRGGYPSTCVDCADVPWNDTIITPASYRQIRGGSAADYDTQIVTDSRWYYNDPGFRIDNIGVRCARNP